MYTVSQAEALTGIPSTTLRAWERRYGIIAPRRTEGGYRLYDAAQIAMLREMAAHGFNVEVEPDGAFYVLVNMAHVTDDSYRLAMDILEHTGVGVTPGVDFGPGAARYIRFSYANSEKNIREGVSRVAGYLKTL